MKLIKPSVEFINGLASKEALQLIERAGRTAYKSEDKITDDSAARFVSSLIKRGHESVIEHAGITLKWICDRGVSHELVRHRIASYTQESTRYCNYTNEKHGGEMTFIIPVWAMDVLKEASYGPSKGSGWNFEGNDFRGVLDMHTGLTYPLHIFLFTMRDAENMYTKLIQLEQTPQQARAILPNALKTEIIFTMNWRELRHMLRLRMDKAAHPDMIYLADMTYRLLDDMGYGILLEGVK